MSAIDLLVLGTGTAGATVARACGKAGWNVAIADPASAYPTFGSNLAGMIS